MTLFQQYNQDASFCIAGKLYDQYDGDMDTLNELGEPAPNGVVFSDGSRVIFSDNANDIIIPPKWNVADVFHALI